MLTRHGGHKYEIDNQTRELGVHFTGCGLELQIIDSVTEVMDMALIQMEGVW